MVLKILIQIYKLLVTQKIQHGRRSTGRVYRDLDKVSQLCTVMLYDSGKRMASEPTFLPLSTRDYSSDLTGPL